MNRRQKRILAILAIVDLTLVGILGATLGRDLLSVHPPPTFLPAACPPGLLQALPPSLQPAVAWTPTRLELTLQVHYATPSPPPEAAQLLWKALDSTAGLVQLGCPAPPQINIRLTATGTAQTHYHLVTLEGPTLAAWAAGQLTETELIQRTTYHQLSSP